jgi:hypothetical protein
LLEPGTELTVLLGFPGEPQTEIRAGDRTCPYKPDDRRRDVTGEDALVG